MLDVDEDSRLGREIIAGGTRYGVGMVPNESTIADMYTEAVERFGAAGIPQYEISNFARAGQRSRHNLKYWTRQPYLGFGLDAHSFLPTAPGETIRVATTDDLTAYLDIEHRRRRPGDNHARICGRKRWKKPGSWACDSTMASLLPKLCANLENPPSQPIAQFSSKPRTRA